MTEVMSKILVIGATGYLGKYMVKCSVSMGHPTFVYTLPITPNTHSSKLQLLGEFESMGVTIFQGELDEHEKLVSVLRQVEVVISTLSVPQHLQQLSIINAIKDAGNIKRFVPSEYGNEVERVSVLPPFQPLIDNKKKIRRATEAAGIPYTYVVANALAAYFVNVLLHPQHQSDEVTVYGTGAAKAVLNYEQDVAAYTIKAACDPRAINRVINCRPPQNIVSQLDLISSWEKKIGKNLKKIHFPEKEIVKLSQTLKHPDNIPISIIHNIFVQGDQTSFDLEEDDLEAFKLYPDYEYTSVDRLLNIFLVNPPKPYLTPLD